MESISILIVDDHSLIRETWSSILNNHPELKVVAECGSGEEAVELTKRLSPDIVLMDINLPGMSGMEATQQIRKYAPAVKIIAVSLHIQPAYARKMMQNGAMGYVTKNSSLKEMIEAIHLIHKGQKYVCHEIKNMLSQEVLIDNEQQNVLGSLSRREIEIINFLKKGYSTKEIANALHRSAKTVEVHRYNILKKLNLKNTAALVNFINNQV